MTGSMLFDPQDDLQVMFANDPKKPLLEGDSCFNRVVSISCCDHVLVFIWQHGGYSSGSIFVS
jgi:hypothetical protein